MQNHNPWNPDTYKDATPDAENAGVNQMIIGAMRAGKPWNAMAAQELRDFLASGNSPLGTPVYSEKATSRTIPGPAGPLTLRTFIPEKIDGVYLHIHGGGWVIGRADGQDALLENISRNCNLAVLSVEYRLAPEHPFPAGPVDCEAAAVWLTNNAKKEFGTERIFIGGESAGGHLSALTVLRMRDRHKFTSFAGANLVFGVFDLGLTPSAASWGDEPLVINTPVMQWFINHFGVTDMARSPEVSPLYAELGNMPPALFTIGTRDPLRDDSLFMYMRWIAGGNKAELAVYPGGAHGFTAFPTQMGAASRARCEAFLRG